MALVSRADVAPYLAEELTPQEWQLVDMMRDALSAEVVAAVGPLGVSAGDTLTFRPSEDLRVLHLPAPLTDVTSVDADGEHVEVDRFASSGTVILASTVAAGSEVVVTFDHGATVPANVAMMLGGKIAAAIRAARTSAAVRAANPDGVQSKTIGSTTTTFFSQSADMADWYASAGARFGTLSDDERRRLRVQFGKRTTTAAVR